VQVQESRANINLTLEPGLAAGRLELELELDT